MANSSSYGTLPGGTVYMNNYTCPSNAVHTKNCTFNYTTIPQCASSTYYAIQCSRRLPGKLCTVRHAIAMCCFVLQFHQ